MSGVRFTPRDLANNFWNDVDAIPMNTHYYSSYSSTGMNRTGSAVWHYSLAVKRDEL